MSMPATVRAAHVGGFFGLCRPKHPGQHKDREPGKDVSSQSARSARGFAGSSAVSQRGFSPPSEPESQDAREAEPVALAVSVEEAVRKAHRAVPIRAVFEPENMPELVNDLSPQPPLEHGRRLLERAPLIDEPVCRNDRAGATELSLTEHEVETRNVEIL
jgi:hypothetical protein